MQHTGNVDSIHLRGDMEDGQLCVGLRADKGSAVGPGSRGPFTLGLAPIPNMGLPFLLARPRPAPLTEAYEVLDP